MGRDSHLRDSKIARLKNLCVDTATREMEKRGVHSKFRMDIVNRVLGNCIPKEIQADLGFKKETLDKIEELTKAILNGVKQNPGASKE